MCWGEEKPFTSFRLRSVLASGVEGKRRDGRRKGQRVSVKSHCDYECNCSSGAQGPCSSDGAGRCFMGNNIEEESENEEREKRGRVGGRDRLPVWIIFSRRISFLSLRSSLLLFSSSTNISLLFSSLLFSFLLSSFSSCPPPLAGLAGSR